jgi:hypothetical protein
LPQQHVERNQYIDNTSTEIYTTSVHIQIIYSLQRFLGPS